MVRRSLSAPPNSVSPSVAANISDAAPVAALLTEALEPSCAVDNDESVQRPVGWFVVYRAPSKSPYIALRGVWKCSWVQLLEVAESQGIGCGIHCVRVGDLPAARIEWSKRTGEILHDDDIRRL